ncbi:ATP-binding cassette domain-containing protein [Paenibacillus mesophilus]|uniref:ABC transporter ATP-binding protein n=1 Tax=Paenibacillus mesophilus TaxID=2582849 RepID=UPI00110EAAEF|nr:ATP-binding cassette domain-containing protein [Paenibacillus mesophilus]TMV50269.1 ATP-binding cassette domain-containing protein [Paenibacillus mesophilus]
MIRLENIHFIRGERTILNDVNMHMQQGENWVVLGKNGSGKTTVLELITGYQFPSSGKVRVLGQPYGEIDLRMVRNKIGYISQSLMEKLTMRDPVWEVVATGEYGFLRFYQDIPDEVKRKAIEKLEQVRLPHLAEQPLGTLSQGERKKIMLARALMTDPSVLILDEPCSGLDLYERELLLDDIQTLGKSGLLMVYVTHHIEEIVPVFTHIALMDQGKIVAQGEKKQVLTAQLLRDAYHVPVEIDWVNDRPWIHVV